MPLYSSCVFPVPTGIERKIVLRACSYEAVVVPGDVVRIDVSGSHVAVLIEPLEMAMNVQSASPL